MSECTHNTSECDDFDDMPELEDIASPEFESIKRENYDDIDLIHCQSNQMVGKTVCVASMCASLSQYHLKESKKPAVIEIGGHNTEDECIIFDEMPELKDSVCDDVSCAVTADEKHWSDVQNAITEHASEIMARNLIQQGRRYGKTFTVTLACASVILHETRKENKEPINLDVHSSCGIELVHSIMALIDPVELVTLAKTSPIFLNGDLIHYQPTLTITTFEGYPDIQTPDHYYYVGDALDATKCAWCHPKLTSDEVTLIKTKKGNIKMLATPLVCELRELLVKYELDPSVAVAPYFLPCGNDDKDKWKRGLLMLREIMSSFSVKDADALGKKIPFIIDGEAVHARSTLTIYENVVKPNDECEGIRFFTKTHNLWNVHVNEDVSSHCLWCHPNLSPTESPLIKCCHYYEHDGGFANHYDNNLLDGWA